MSSNGPQIFLKAGASRATEGSADNLYEFDDFRLDARNRILLLRQDPVPLTAKALDALLVLVMSEGRLLTKDDLMRAVWPDSIVEESNLTQTIFMLRKALGQTRDQGYIVTVPGRGYRFVAEVKHVSWDGPVLVSTVPAGRGAEIPIKRQRTLFQQWPALVGIAAILIVAAGAYVLWFRSQPRPAQPLGRSMLAVLPFQNLTGDPTQDYFSDGLTEEMISQLGNLDAQHLGVIARTSTMYYKNRPQPLQQVGRDLRVEYVLEGSVRRDHEQARISVRLVRVADGTTLWTDSFDRHVGDVLALQSEIARRIGSELQVQVLGRSRPKPARPEVVEAYLRGRFELNRLDVRDAAPAYFERTIALDPSYAPAYAGLADFYCFRAVRDDEGSEQAWLLAEQYATQALSLDAESEEAHTAIARIKLMHDWDWPAAREHALRALQLNPSSPEAHGVYALYLRVAGNIPEDLSHRQQALAVDPYRADLKQQLIFERYFARDYQPAVDSARQLLASDPNNSAAHVDLCIDLGRLRLFDQSVAECSKALALEGHADWTAAYEREYRQNGYEAASLLIAKKQLEEILKRPHPDLWDLANAYVLAGMPEKALRTLFRGLPTHEPGLLQIRVDPDFDPIRSDPRYAELIRQIGFPNK